jgi:arylsulfatase A-like enzyme
VHAPIEVPPERSAACAERIRAAGLYPVHLSGAESAAEVAEHAAKAAEAGLEFPIEMGAPFPTEHKHKRRIIRRLRQADPAYMAMVENLDDNIGRVLAALEESGQADHTLVVLTSDNGGLSTAESSPTSNAPLREGKGWMEEGGVRVPWLFRWPGQITAGTTSSEPLATHDLYPTFLAAAGLAPLPEQHVDGVDLGPVFAGGTLDREALYWHYPQYGNQGATPGCSVRKGPWKLIEFFEDGHLELYHLPDDPGEAVDRAADEADIRDELHDMLKAWRTEVGAEIPGRNLDWPPPDFGGDPAEV